MNLFRMEARLLSLWLVLLLPSTLFAWGGDGHQIVCLIAEEHLSPAAKVGIHDLLGADVNISDAEIASWADNIRRERRNTASWHFVDIPVDARGFDEQRDGKHGNNVIDKINQFERVLSDHNAPKEKRAEALKFLVHFVGDLHQPLHCADRNDKGGNSRLVFFLDQPRALNLHTVWDTTILLHRKGRARVLQYAAALNRKISKEQAKQWKQGTVEDWANESHMIAVNVAYRGIPADGRPPQLDQAYVDRAGDAIDQQLQRAGVRLAMLLNQSFAKIGRAHV